MSTTTLQFIVARQGRDPSTIDVPIGHLVIAGWTGRSQESLQRHIEEMTLMGVSVPAHAPLFFRASHSRLSHADRIETLARENSGEVEFFLLGHSGELYVGVGSDHTDNALERQGSTLSKQICDKPVSRTVWPYQEVRDHWDDLLIRSWIEEAGHLVAYQESSVRDLLHPDSLLAELAREGETFGDGSLMFGGTVNVEEGIRWTGRFVCAIEDPVLKRHIQHEYAVSELPVRG